jgi:hypothetical protein
MQRRARLGTAAMIIGLAMTLACGGSHTTTTGTVPPSGTPAPTTPRPATASAAGTSIPAAGLTAVARGIQAVYYDYRDPDGRYVVRLPQDWTLTHATNATSVTLPGTPFAAVIGIFCAPTETIEQLKGDDKTIAQNASLGILNFTQPEPLTVDGSPANAYRWSGTLGDHLYVYVEDGGCAWRFLLTTFQSYYTLDSMRPVFDAVLQSFHVAG